MMKRIIMAVTNDLVTDQRVDRNCNTLTEAGYDVTLVGRRLADSQPLTERKYKTCRMKLWFRRSALFYAEYNIRLFLKLLFAKADAFYANDSDTLLACAWAARLRKKKLFFDAHELFPEVPELVNKPKVRRVWQWVEKTCLPHVDKAFTVCESVAAEYKSRYGKDMRVVRNLPDWSVENEEHKVEHQRPWTLLYQGAVNVGRGVRELMDAMEMLPDCRLVVAGNGDLLEELMEYHKQLRWNERITFLGRVVPAELHKWTSNADLGLCLLEDMGLNYRYSLPNRIADFAHAGVPMLATGFVEIKRVIEAYQIGALVGPCPQQKDGEEYKKYIVTLAEAVKNVLHRFWEEMAEEERTELFARAACDLDWKREKNIYLDGIGAIL
ncbi:MAG: glycosyltransferase [Bacteroidales bacterium]|nr:glycosyltransferase [Bacteroidales bacterium]